MIDHLKSIGLLRGYSLDDNNFAFVCDMGLSWKTKFMLDMYGLDVGLNDV